ncbi:MAG: alpha/beta hydrolase [Leptospira sp.]|nr:alpha/beta hydrolase [Leptospira sp.]
MFRFLEYFERFWAYIAFYLPSHLQTSNFKDRNILIVPGFKAGRSFYQKLKSNLDNLGFRVGILSTLRNSNSLEEAVAYLAKQILTAPNEITLIAHNTGGLLVLILPDEARRKVKRLITLGTPFHGSVVFNDSKYSYWGYDSEWVRQNYKNALFFPLFQPLSAIEDFSFRPQESTEFGQGRDLWFDVPGNYNLVRRGENLRTIREFLGTPKDPSNLSPAPKPNLDFAAPKKIEVDFSKFEPSRYKKAQLKNQKQEKPVSKAKKTKTVAKPVPKKKKLTNSKPAKKKRK